MAWRRRMETRTAKIEATLPHLATKADLQAAINTLTWRLIAGMIAVAVVIVVALWLWPTGG